MRTLRFIGIFLIAFALTTAATGRAFAAPPSSQAKWTVMVYISGDNDLENYIKGDFETELAPTGSSANVQVVALVDRGPGYDRSYGDWQTTKLYHVTKGMKPNTASAVADWGEKDMADPQTLLEFVSWSKANYPAGHYALVFWGHGWNWHPGYTMRDTTPADTLDYDEMKSVIPALGFMDVVAYDGCNMASIEVFDLWHGHATAVASSQEYVWWEGLQYDLVLAQLAADPEMTADELAVAFASSATRDKTWSAVAVDDRLNALVSAVDEWSAALRQGLDGNSRKYKLAFDATRTFWEAPEDNDLYDMAFEINRRVTDADIRSRSQAVMDAVTAVVLYERHAPSYRQAHGITIYHISKRSEMDANF
ncbi:MAG TPA: clostripain-related cysteine peptidase, partial [Anaerolineales bacterium]